MTARSTHLVLVPGLVCTEDLFAEQIASLRGEIAISVADHARHDTMSAIARAVFANGTQPIRVMPRVVRGLPAARAGPPMRQKPFAAVNHYGTPRNRLARHGIGAPGGIRIVTIP
jgi:hypothetical protein